MTRFYLLTAIFVAIVIATFLPHMVVSEQLQKRVYGGTAARQDQFKFIVGLFVNSSQVCTGFIINKHYIGTAAHCIPTGYSNDTLFHIVTYLNDTNIDERPDTKVSATVLYKDYRFTFSSLQYDIAILRVKEPLTLGPYLTAIPLADKLPESGATVYTCGYGDTAPDVNNYTLNYADLFFVTKNECLEYYNASKLIEGVCASSNQNKSSCFGDSGSALFTTSDIDNPSATAVAVGILSFGKACGSAIPVVYTDIPNFGKAWFEDKIARSSYCPQDCRADFRRCLENVRKCRLAKKRCLSKCIIV